MSTTRSASEPTGHVTIAHVNMGGVNDASASALGECVRNLRGKRPDILILTELHTIDDLECAGPVSTSLGGAVKGYKLLLGSTSPSRYSTAACGVGFLVRTPLFEAGLVHVRQDVTNTGRLAWLTLITGANSAVHIAAVYGPSDRSPATRDTLIAELLSSTSALRQRRGSDDVLWVGDMNAWMLPPLWPRTAATPPDALDWRDSNDWRCCSSDTAGGAWARACQAADLVPLNLLASCRGHFHSIVNNRRGPTARDTTTDYICVARQAAVLKGVWCEILDTTPNISDHRVILARIPLANPAPLVRLALTLRGAHNRSCSWTVPDGALGEGHALGVQYARSTGAALRRLARAPPTDGLPLQDRLDGHLTQALTEAARNTFRTWAPPRTPRSSAPGRPHSAQVRTLLREVSQHRLRLRLAQPAERDAIRRDCRRTENRLRSAMAREQRRLGSAEVRRMARMSTNRHQFRRQLIARMYAAVRLGHDGSQSHPFPLSCSFQENGRTVVTVGAEDVLAAFARQLAPPMPALSASQRALVADLVDLRQRAPPRRVPCELAPTHAEVLFVIARLNGSVSTADTASTVDMFKCAVREDPTVARTVTKIIRTIWRTGTIPERWKRLRTTMIPKEGADLQRGTNWRPITVSGIMLKVLDSLVHLRLRDWCTSHHAIPDTYVGFLAGRSLVDEEITWATLAECIRQDARRVLPPEVADAVSVFLDIQKAYDTTWHDGLELKLRRLGVPPRLILLVNALSRGFSTVITSPSGLHSVPVPLATGVRQGSSLSPLLYVLFLSDLPAFLATCGVAPITLSLEEAGRAGRPPQVHQVPLDPLGYADDLVKTVALPHRAGPATRGEAPISPVSQHVPPVLAALLRYSDMWGFRFSPTKTVLMYITHRPQRHDAAGAPRPELPAFALDGSVLPGGPRGREGGPHPLPWVNEFRLLGALHSASGSPAPLTEALLSRLRTAYRHLRASGILAAAVPLSMVYQVHQAVVGAQLSPWFGLVGNTRDEDFLAEVHSQIRRILDIPKWTNLDVLFWEIGRLPPRLHWPCARLLYIGRLLLNSLNPPESPGMLLGRLPPDGQTRWTPLTAAAIERVNPTRALVQDMLRRIDRYPRSPHLVNHRVRKDLACIAPPEEAAAMWQTLCTAAPMSDTVLAAEACRAWCTRILSSAWRTLARQLYGQTGAVGRQQGSAAVLTVLSTGSPQGTPPRPTPGLMTSALPYLSTCRDRRVSRTRLLLRTNSLPVAAARIRGLGMHPARLLCTLCGTGVPQTSQHVLCVCPHAAIATARQIALDLLTRVVDALTCAADQPTRAHLCARLRDTPDVLYLLLGGVFSPTLPPHVLRDLGPPPRAGPRSRRGPPTTHRIAWDANVAIVPPLRVALPHPTIDRAALTALHGIWTAAKALLPADIFND